MNTIQLAKTTILITDNQNNLIRAYLGENFDFCSFNFGPIQDLLDRLYDSMYLTFKDFSDKFDSYGIEKYYFVFVFIENSFIFGIPTLFFGTLSVFTTIISVILPFKKLLNLRASLSSTLFFNLPI